VHPTGITGKFIENASKAGWTTVIPAIPTPQQGHAGKPNPNCPAPSEETQVGGAPITRCATDLLRSAVVEAAASRHLLDWLTNSHHLLEASARSSVLLPPVTIIELGVLIWDTGRMTGYPAIRQLLFEY
jgi:hypothetical protein